MASGKVMEEACNDFRMYFRSSGISAALVTALMSLYQVRKRPQNPIEFIRQHLPPIEEDTTASLTSLVAELKTDIANIRKSLPKKPPKAEIKEEEEAKSMDSAEQDNSEAKPEESSQNAIEASVAESEQKIGDMGSGDQENSEKIPDKSATKKRQKRKSKNSQN